MIVNIQVIAFSCNKLQLFSYTILEDYRGFLACLSLSIVSNLHVRLETTVPIGWELTLITARNCLTGLVVKTSDLRAEEPEFESHSRLDFSGVESYQ